MRSTILNISHNILEICKSHLLVEYIFAGSIDKLDDKVDFKGRTAWLTVQNIGLREGRKIVRFNLIMLDKENSDRSNELQIQSDCSQILVDIAGRLNQLPLNNSWLDIESSEIEPFVEKHNGYLAGATMSFDYVTLEDYNTCDAPFDDSTPTDAGEYITSVNKYLTCETLANCPTIINIQEEIAAITGNTGLTCETITGCTTIQDILTDLANLDLAITSIQDDIDTIFADLSTKFNNPTGDTTQYIAGDGSLVTFPVLGEAGSLVRQVRNETGATLTKGTIVYINGASGNKATVTKAIATGDGTSAQTFGFIQADIPNNQNGYAVVRGEISGVDTSAVSGGTQLYLSSTVAGTWTSTKQYAPNHLVYVGIVTRSHQNQGSIEVAIQNGFELDELHDVQAQTPSNRDTIIFDSSDSQWKSGALTKSDIGLGNVNNTSDASKAFTASQITGGTFAAARIPQVSRPVIRITTPASSGNSTNEQNITSITIPANSLAVGDIIRLGAFWSFAGNSTTKTPRVRFGLNTTTGTNILFGPSTVSASVTCQTIELMGIVTSTTNLRMANATTVSGLGQGTGATINFTIDTSSTVSFSFNVQKNAGADIAILEFAWIEILTA